MRHKYPERKLGIVPQISKGVLHERKSDDYYSTLLSSLLPPSMQFVKYVGCYQFKANVKIIARSKEHGEN